MIGILLSTDGSQFKVFDPKTRADLTDQYQCNMMVIETKDGRKIAGIHIGQDKTAEINEACMKAAAEAAAAPSPLDDEDGILGSGPRPNISGGRYGRG